ncbi:4-hydroxy-tetrahydrodipicolinate reductase [Phenylobacterium sp.]|uniref:4-hydroxy-tetrahydrodipicolinate reductase n=1 Tax=Phenylobacterium sp. TaxID=1871053 RepID=UPI0035693025
MRPAGVTPLPDTQIKIAVAGAMGRMGQAMCDAVLAEPGLVLAARFDRPGLTGEGLVGQDAALAIADVVVDFSTPAASTALAEVCAGRGGPALLLGATGFEPHQIAAIESAALKIPIVRAGNFSLGLNMMLGFVEQTARRLDPEAYDIEVFEAHHRRKIDAPSGAALMLGEAAARGRGVSLAKVAKRGRDGITGARTPGEIGFSVVRGGGIVGEHSVSFIAEDESFTLSHSARDRGLFARGAIVAVRWVAGRPPGQYDMRDVLGFSGRS